MAGTERTIRAHRLRAEAAVERAMSGELVKTQSYSLQCSDGQYRIGLPPLFPRNTDFSKEDDASVFLDLQEGIAVYDFGGSIEEAIDEQE